MHILVTGTAGFIGLHLTRRFLEQGDTVVGLDNLNDYYEVSLKRNRLLLLEQEKGFEFSEADLSDSDSIREVFDQHTFDRVVNLAAQAEVRYSLENPKAYIDTNIVGFLNILENCRHVEVPHLLYASSSSAYGANTKMSLSVHHNVDHPVNLYAASKKSNELMAHKYSYLFGLPSTGLRFFMVYGPWGRPDMAVSLFAKVILNGEPIEVFNHGKMQRDFTCIDDIVEGVVRVTNKIPASEDNWSGDHPNPATSKAPYRIYNIGNHEPVKLFYFIEVLEKALGWETQKEFLPIQPGDIPATDASVEALEKDVSFRPNTPHWSGD